MAYYTDKILIRKNHPVYEYCIRVCENYKNMFNTSLFVVRQSFTAYGKDSLSPLQEEVRRRWDDCLPEMQKKHPSWENPFDTGKLPTYYMLEALFRLSRNADCYAEGFPIHTAQNSMKEAVNAMKGFFASLKQFKKNPAGYTGKVNFPKYCKSKMKTAVLSNEECINRNGQLKLPKCRETVSCRPSSDKLKEVKIMPYHDAFFILLTYENKTVKECRQPNRIASIDLGVNNLAAIVSNTGKKSLLFSGRALKSIREKESKDLAKLASRQTKGTTNRLVFSKKARQVILKASLRTSDYLHKTAADIIRWCNENDIDTLVVGSNEGWKQECSLNNKKSTRMFERIPFWLFRQMLQYRCEREGINYIETEESYTSKASFLDLDEFDANLISGVRTKRGLYRTKNGQKVNADLNSAANIGRKAFPELFQPENVNIHQVQLIKHPENFRQENTYNYSRVMLSGRTDKGSVGLPCGLEELVSTVSLSSQKPRLN